MLVYQLRLALKSLRRNPALSALMVAGVALGIGVAMTSLTAHYHLTGNPIPHKSGRLFRAEVSLKRARIGGQNRMLAILRDITERKA